MKVILTGAAGFLGRHTAARLEADGHTILRISGTTRTNTSKPYLSRSIDPDSLQQQIHSFAPDLCLFIGAADSRGDDVSSCDDLIRGNIAVPARIASAAILAGCQKVVHIGSSWQEVEGSGFKPFDLYSATKEAAFDVLAHWAINQEVSVTQLQLFDTYGPDDQRKKLLNILFDACISGDEVDLSPGAQALHLVHVLDVVNAIVCVVNDDGGERLRKLAVPSSKATTLLHLVALIQDLGETLHVNFGARPYRRGEIMNPTTQYNPPDGWSPQISLVDGLRECLAARRRSVGGESMWPSIQTD